MPLIQSPYTNYEKAVKEQREAERDSKTIAFRVPLEMYLRLVDLQVRRKDSDLSQTMRYLLARVLPQEEVKARPLPLNNISESTQELSKGERLALEFGRRLTSSRYTQGWGAQ